MHIGFRYCFCRRCFYCVNRWSEYNFLLLFLHLSCICIDCLNCLSYIGRNFRSVTFIQCLLSRFCIECIGFISIDYFPNILAVFFVKKKFPTRLIYITLTIVAVLIFSSAYRTCLHLFTSLINKRGYWLTLSYHYCNLIISPDPLHRHMQRGFHKVVVLSSSFLS